MERVIVAHYGEIALKGLNRPFFVRRLLHNVRRQLGDEFRVETEESRILIRHEDPDSLEEALKKLSYVFGIASYGYGTRCESNLDSIVEAALQELIPRKGAFTSFSIRATRSYKLHPFTSMDVKKTLGKAIAEELHKKVDYDAPDITVNVEVGKESAYVYTHRSKGLGGLPVGVSGRVLSLLSGGVDSATAAWLVMKRGCEIDYIHFHAYRDGSEVLDTKIPELVNVLVSYGIESRLLLAPFTPFYILSTKAPPRLENSLFRHFMFKVADKVALALGGYGALLTGDSLGQVASQTLPNIHATQQGITHTVLRPLIALDKNEIGEWAMKIGIWEVAQKEYKDCCSIVSRHPATKTDPQTLQRVWKELELDRAVEETFSSIETFLFKLGSKPVKV